MGRPRETGALGRLSRLQLAHAAGVPEATIRSLEARGALPEARVPGLAPIQVRVAAALPSDQAAAATGVLEAAWAAGPLPSTSVLVVADGQPAFCSSLIQALPLVERAVGEARVFPVGSWLAEATPERAAS